MALANLLLAVATLGSTAAFLSWSAGAGWANEDARLSAVKATVRSATIHLKYFSDVLPGNLLPQFLFLQGESDGLSQDLSLTLGGGRGEKLPFVPDDSCDAAVFEGASEDLRSPQLPYTKKDRWGCERKPREVPAVAIESTEFVALVTPQFGGKIWGMKDKVSNREFFYSSASHQPANIGATGAWTAGGLEFNWSPGFLGHSVFAEEEVWLARLNTSRGDVLRAYEFDRYNGTVWQIDMLVEGGELWTHAKITNPTDGDLPGYWWTCAAHRATPDSRILSPANRVSVEPYVGAGVRDSPWPHASNGLLNTSFQAREVDSSYLGNIPYTGDYFLRIPEGRRRWIAHLDKDGYAAVHGHSMNGTKFFTWGQSGPGRFMQDFLAGGEVRQGDYTELQTGLTPTQMQVFSLPRRSSVSFTEYYKPLRNAGKAWGQDYDRAVAAIEAWLDSAAGVPKDRVAAMESFFKDLEDRRPLSEEIVAVGSSWGALEEAARGAPLAPGALFFSPEGQGMGDPAALWEELLRTGTFSATTLAATRAPASYLVSPLWVERLERSVQQHGSTWLHDLFLGVAYAEAGEVERPRALFQRALQKGSSPVAARCLAVLGTDADAAWDYLQTAWKLALAPAPAGEAPDVATTLRANLMEEMLRLALGRLGTAATDANVGRIKDGEVWLGRLRVAVEQAATGPADLTGPYELDTWLQARILLHIVDGEHSEALALLASKCFPTFGHHRDALKQLWHLANLRQAEVAEGRTLKPAEAHRLRRQKPVPRNIGCAYAGVYCEDYW